MKFVEFALKNSLLVNLISLLIIVVGIFSMVNLRKEAFPPVDYDIVTITTVYSGAPAEDVEKFVTIPIEKEIKGISGIKELTSKSEEGISEIGITIDPRTKDKKQVIDDIERAVDRVKNLPAGVKDEPDIFKIRSKEIPILEISLTGTANEFEKRYYAEALEDVLLNVNGVSKIRRISWLDPEFHVEVDPEKLKDFHVSINEVMQALATKNITLPGGKIKSATQERNIRTTADFASADEIGNVSIRANDSGNWLRVKDVAQVSSGFADGQFIARTNGERSLGLVVIKNETGDIIQVVDKVRQELDAFKEEMPDNISVSVANDLSYYVKRRLGVLQSNGLLGFVLVVIVLFLFLDPIPAIITALGIPIAFFMTFFIMNWAGISINLVSMLGLIIVLGMLVDDGIIVSENVYRYIEQGLPPREAAIRGTSEVIAPVTSTIITTFAAFAPLFFIPDVIGKFIKEIPVVVIIALSASLMEAFIILPSHLADFIKIKKDQDGKPIIKSGQKQKWFKGIQNFYVRILTRAIKHRYKVIAGLIIASVLIVVFAVSIYKIKVILFTGAGIEEFSIRAEAPQGTSLEYMEELIRPVERLVASLDKTELDSYRSYVGSISEHQGFDPNAKNGSHLAQITVFLTPMQKRDRGPKEIIDSLRSRLGEIPGFNKLYFYSPKEGPPIGNAVEVGIKGEKFEVSQKIAETMVKYLETIDGVSDVAMNYELGKKELRIMVDEEKAKKYNLTAEDIASTVRHAFNGGVATTVKPLKAEDEIEVIVRFPPKDRRDLKDFEKIFVLNKLGNLVPLSSVSTIEEKDGVYAITHLDGKRVIWVTANVDGENTTSLKVNQALQEKFKNVNVDHPGYFLKYGGEYEEQKETLANLLFSLVIALLLIFIILTAQFGSLIQPLIVMLAIPFGILGILVAFMAHGLSLSFFALMGAVGLTGVVVNDSIVLVDFVNQLRKSGHDRLDSLIEAGRTRLRPILMTSITTIAGLVSVAYGIGGGDPFLKPMGLAIIWGLFFSTALILIVIPCIYAIIDDWSMKTLRKPIVKMSGKV